MSISNDEKIVHTVDAAWTDQDGTERSNIRKQSIEEVAARLNNDNSRCVIATMLNRPGSSLFMVKLEYTHFTPDTPANDQFNFHVIYFCGMPWVVCDIPADKELLAIPIAESCGLRLTHNVPMMIEETGYVTFPICGSNFRCLESMKDHPVYQNNPKMTEMLLKSEEVEAQAIMDDHLVRFRRGEFGFRK